MERYKRTRKIKKEIQGVTMLALVVTIIVLLILAAITLNLAVGENGIVERAKLARDKAKNASIAEEEAMNGLAGEIDNAGNGGSGGGTCPECPDTKPLEDRIKELESQVGALQQQLETETANKAELENRITELNNQIAELNKQIEAGNIQIGELQAEITRLQNQLAASQAENERLRAQIAELNTQKAELETEITRLQSQLEASQAENEKLREQIEKLNTQKAELETEIARLQNQLAAVQTENEKLQGQITNLNNQIGNLNTQIGEKNKTIETQKQTIANLQGQITEKDRLISQKNETIKTMQGTIDGLNTQIANLNNQINQLKAKQATGNVAVGDVLKGKTFSNSSGVGLIGTMANNGAISKTLNAGQSYTVPAGYHNGSGKVTAASLASQTSGTAVAGDLLTGKTAWVNGKKLTGTNKGYTIGYEEGYQVGKRESSKEIVYLGTQKTFDIKSLYPEEYKNFTKDNFITEIEKVTLTASKGGLSGNEIRSVDNSFSKVYDPVTGVYSFNMPTNYTRVHSFDPDNWAYGSETHPIYTFKTYLVK